MVSNIFYFHPYLGKWSNIFQMGCNHQLEQFWSRVTCRVFGLEPCWAQFLNCVSCLCLHPCSRCSFFYKTVQSFDVTHGQMMCSNYKGKPFPIGSMYLFYFLPTLGEKWPHSRGNVGNIFPSHGAPGFGCHGEHPQCLVFPHILKSQVGGVSCFSLVPWLSKEEYVLIS